MYVITPMLHMSTSLSYPVADKTSGATYPGVPEKKKKKKKKKKKSDGLKAKQRKREHNTACCLHHDFLGNDFGKPEITYLDIHI